MARLTFICGLAFAAAVGISSPAANDQPLTARLQPAAVTPVDMGDSGIAVFEAPFSPRVTNQSSMPILLPRVASGEDTERIAVIVKHLKLPDGTWKYLSQASWYGTSTTKYDPCISVPPGSVAEYPAVPYRLFLIPNQLADLGKESTLKYSLWLFCQMPDGKVLTQSVTTEPFVLRLPPAQ